MGGLRWGECECVGDAPSTMHMHACTHTPTCMLNMMNMDASMLVAICNLYTCIHVHVCMCMYACVCAYV